MEKELKKGFKKVPAKERTVFNDEEQRRYNLVHCAFSDIFLRSHHESSADFDLFS